MKDEEKNKNLSDRELLGSESVKIFRGWMVKGF